jgi:hypothetical protein
MSEGFFCSLDAIYGGLGIGELLFLIKKIFSFSSCKFFHFLAIKTLDSDWIRISIQPKMLDPDPYQMISDLKPWYRNSHTCVGTKPF